MGNLFISTLQENPAYYFAVVITVILSVTLHELAHGWTAVWMGDRTPIEMDRLTPNPLVHMGMLSIILVFVVGIGWGAMPVNPSRMRGKYADAVVSFAGPAMNLLIAFVVLTVYGVWSNLDPSAGEKGSISSTLFFLFQIAGIWNIVLAMFNLFPIPPMDGSRILASLVPAYRDWAYTPTMIGVWNAVFFAAFFFAGTILWPVAINIAGTYVRFLLSM